MANLLKSEYAKLIFQSFILVIGVSAVQILFQNYFTPKTAADTLKKENFLNSKRDAYLEAISVANKYMANSRIGKINLLTGDTLQEAFIRTEDKVSLDTFEVDINNAYNNLLIYAPDTSILNSYFRIFVASPNGLHIPVVWLQKFVTAIREDLGNDSRLPKDFRLEYIAMPKKKKG